MFNKKIFLVFVAILIIHLAFGGAFREATKLEFQIENLIVSEKNFEKGERTIGKPKWVKNFYNDERLFPIKYDTIIIDSKSFIDQQFLKLERTTDTDVLLKSIKSSSQKVNKEFCALDKDNLYHVLSNFNLLNNISLDVYVALIAKDESIDTDIKVEYDEADKNYFITRKFEKFYGVNEMPNYIQLIVVGYGKYYPTIYLRTYTKENFTFVSEAVLYEFKVGDDSVERIKSCYKYPFKALTINKLNSIDVSPIYIPDDTISFNYTVSSFGRIVRTDKNNN